jgi:hypothetical protein
MEEDPAIWDGNASSPTSPKAELSIAARLFLAD